MKGEYDRILPSAAGNPHTQDRFADGDAFGTWRARSVFVRWLWLGEIPIAVYAVIVVTVHDFGTQPYLQLMSLVRLSLSLGR